MGAPLLEIHCIQVLPCVSITMHSKGLPSCPCAAVNLPFIFQIERKRHPEPANAGEKLAKKNYRNLIVKLAVNTLGGRMQFRCENIGFYTNTSVNTIDSELENQP